MAIIVMKRLASVIIIAAMWAITWAQNEPVLPNLNAVPSAMQKVFAGYYQYVDTESGDTTVMVVFNNITVFPRERFRSKKDEEFYWKTVRDVKRTLPYAKLICSTLLETYEYLETYDTKKEKEEYLKAFEKEIFRQYKPEMKRMTKAQGKLLLKLINRETNQSSYHLVKAFLGTFRAGFWQTFGRFFGVNMKSGYKPDKDKTDAMIERICVRIEQGTL